jgi:hypothetical protein
VNDEAHIAQLAVPTTPDLVNASQPAAPRRRKLAANTMPLEQRILIDLVTAANLASVSPRTLKRIGREHPELVVTLNRRRLFHQARLRAWLADGCPAAKPKRR